MKDGANAIVGRTIAQVIIKEAKGASRPRSLVLLGFTDGTWFEFYSDGDISPAGGLDRSPMKDYLAATHATVFQTDHEGPV